MYIRNTTAAARSKGLILAMGTVGLTALAAIAFPGETSKLAPFALVLPFLSMALLEALVDQQRHA